MLICSQDYRALWIELPTLLIFSISNGIGVWLMGSTNNLLTTWISIIADWFKTPLNNINRELIIILHIKGIEVNHTYISFLVKQEPHQHTRIPNKIKSLCLYSFILLPHTLSSLEIPKIVIKQPIFAFHQVSEQNIDSPATN